MDAPSRKNYEGTSYFRRFHSLPYSTTMVILSLVRVLLILKTLKVKSQDQQRQLRGFRGREKEIDMEIAFSASI